MHSLFHNPSLPQFQHLSLLAKVLYSYVNPGNLTKWAVDWQVHFFCISCRLWLYVGCVFLLVNVAIAFYLILWCSYYKKIQNWDSYAPFAIPVATAAFIAGMIWLEMFVEQNVQAYTLQKLASVTANHRNSWYIQNAYDWQSMYPLRIFKF